MRIKRSPKAPACVLWDGREVKPGDEIEVAASDAEALLARQPDEWIADADTAKKG